MSTMTAVLQKPRLRTGINRGPSPIRISEQTLDDLAHIFKMLADRSRLKILLALARDGELNVSALCDLLGESQPAVSHHLTLLRRRQLVTFRRDGKNNFYRIDSTLVGYLLDQFFAAQGNGHAQIQFDDFSLIYRRR